MEQVCNYYVGELVTTLVKASLAASNEVMLFSTSLGTIGAFYPFETKEVEITICVIHYE